MMKKRDPQAVRSNFTLNGSGQVVCKNPCTIQVPKDYFQSGLGVLGTEIKIYGFFAVILESGEYSLVNTSAMFSITPTSTSVVLIDHAEYYEFFFAKESVVFPTNELLSESKLIYEPFQNFFFKGRFPHFTDYEDSGKVFDTAPHFAGFGALKNPEVIEFLAASVARRKGSTDNEFLRTKIETYEEGAAKNIDFVPMSSVVLAVHSSLSKISGPYAQDGIISAIVTPSKSVGSVERIVRA